MIVSLLGVEVNVDVHDAGGGGPTLVLIHGFGASSRTWDPVTPALGATHSWVSVDLKGFGLSGRPRDGKYSIADNADLVVALIEQRRLQRVVLVGHSYGGAVAITTVLRLRERATAIVDGLVLIDAASYAQRLPFYVTVLRNPITRWFSGMTSVERSSRLVLQALFVDKSRVDDEMVERYAHPRRIPGSDYAAAQTALQILPESFDAVTRAIQSIDAPTLIIWGGRDSAVPPAFAARLHHDIRGSRVEVLPDAGHMPHEERPAEVIRTIQAFLAALR